MELSSIHYFKFRIVILCHVMETLPQGFEVDTRINDKSNMKCSYVEFVLKCHHFQCPSLASKYLQFPRCLTFYDLTF